MGTAIAPHLTLITELLPIIRQDRYAGDSGVLTPTGTNPLLEGEWLQYNTSYQLVRGSGEATVPSFQVWAERGRYDVQALGKVPVLYIGGYEAETDIATFTGLAVNDMLVVTDVTIGGLTKRGLAKATGAGLHLVVGWVTRLIGTGASQKVRYIKFPTPTWITLPSQPG